MGNSMFQMLAVAHEAAEEPSAFGIEPGGYVALAMIVVLGVMLYARVPAIIAKMLDTRIAGIKQQLDEAAKLRAEAEALRDEFVAKSASAQHDAAAILTQARKDADAIVAKAQADSEAMIGRRQKMAEDKIAAAERAAVEELRTRAASAAAGAAAALIAAKHDEKADRKLVDEAISTL